MWGTWNAPSAVVKEIGVEIYDKNGQERPRNNNVRGTEILWLRYEKQHLERFGCTVSDTGAVLTRDCLDKYRDPPGIYQPFPKGFIKAGMNYKIRVGFVADNHSPRSSWSATHRVKIPKPNAPTPTPKPAPTPTPHPNPAPTKQGETQVQKLFSTHSALDQIWYRDNQGQFWKGYVRSNKNQQTLTVLREGLPYFVVVNKNATIQGHRLYCPASSDCIDMVTW